MSSRTIEYDIQALRDGIEKKKANIRLFEDAIDNENAEIKEYRRMITELEGRNNGGTN
jgi:peptidoglycan hydrolase CwlO-like protein